MKHPEGLFGWIDLSSSDVDVAKEFYSGLFGWTYADHVMESDFTYSMCFKDGLSVAGLGPLPEPMVQAGVPSTWNSYALVEDADAVTAKAVAAGGQVLMPASDIMEADRIALVSDPSGAVLGLWQPQENQGAELFNAPGSLTWNELQTWDLDAALPFYSEVLGWVWEDGDNEGYRLATIPAKEGQDKTNAGAMAMPPGVPEGTPSFWMVYFAVSDCDEAMGHAINLGGTELFAPMEMGPGKFGGLMDPTGAVFAVGSFGNG